MTLSTPETQDDTILVNEHSNEKRPIPIGNTSQYIFKWPMFHCHGILTRVCRYIIIYYHVFVHHFYIFFLGCEFKPSHHPSNPKGIETFRPFGCAIRTSRSRIARGTGVMRDGVPPRRRTLEDCESAMGLRREKLRDTPWKIDMEHTNHPFRKENDLNQTTRELCAMLIFQGVHAMVSKGGTYVHAWLQMLFFIFTPIIWDMIQFDFI